MTQTTTAPRYDQAEAEQFASRIAETINSGAVAMMLSIGHRTGLLDTMARRPPATSAGIAGAAGLDERYVRQWLGAMVTGGIVHYDPSRAEYSLPAEHAACLTRDAPLGNLAVMAQMLPGMGAVEPRVLECFETGEGMHYHEYPGFHHVMAEDSGETVVSRLFEAVLPLVPGLADRLEAGIDVLDAGCGAGRALVTLAEHYPHSRFTGYDLCDDAIDMATRSAERAGLRNARFAVYDLSGFDERERYDLVTSFDAVHDQKDPQALLRAIYAALRPGGVYLMQDIGASARLENNLDFPFASLLYAASTTHCMPVSLGQGGVGLGTMWGWETAEAMLREAGFGAPERHTLPHDPVNVWFVSRKSWPPRERPDRYAASISPAKRRMNSA